MSSMTGFKCAPTEEIRIGVVGIGRRGEWALKRLSKIGSIRIVAVADIEEYRLKEGNAALQKESKSPAKEYLGPESHIALADDPEVDLVYITAPWPVHVPAALAALERGKHCAVEVPCAMSIEDCWRLVEAAEKHRRHVIPLENCCYGDEELLALNLCRQGVLGELVHAEGAYIHDLREVIPSSGKYNGEALWRYGENMAHKGNRYPTHGLVPLCQTMGINRGDRFDFLVSLENGPTNVNYEVFKREYLADSDPRKKDPPAEMGDKCGLYARVTLPPGAVLGYHEHHGNSEAYFILEGEGVYDDNGVKRAVKAGETTWTPDGCGHGLSNEDGKTDLVFMALIINS